MDKHLKQPIRLAEVPAVIAEETGEEINFKTAYRWAVKGKRGVILKTLPGIRKRTTREYVLEFLAALSGRDEPVPAALSRAKQREQDDKTRKLAACGR